MYLLSCFLCNELLAFLSYSSQFMAATRSGLIGLSVAGHVMEESNIVIVHAPTPRLQAEEETAADWGELTSHGHVTHLGAQVNDLNYP